jgi:hypothetical protein
VPGDLKLKTMSSIFRCKLIKGPSILGPFPGPGKSKSENLRELLQKETQYLEKMKAQITELQSVIKSHKDALIRITN